MKDSITKLTGIDKAAVIMMALDEENAKKILNLMDEDEIKELSHAMSSLGTISSDIVERLITEFTGEINSAVSFVGNIETTEKLLQSTFEKDKVKTILEDIRGPAGRTTWDKLGNVNEEALASYLKNEYPQTAALILSKISPAHAAKVLSVLPESFTSEIIMRMLTMDSIKKEMLDEIEKTLRAEFINNLSKTQKYDSTETMAEIFNNFDRTTEVKYMTILEETNQEAAENIKALMFTFDDLTKISPDGIQTILSNVDKGQLTIALKGASETVRDLFINNMSDRAAKILTEDMESMGPIRMRDVDEAQTAIIAITKELAAKNEIVIADKNEEEDLVY